MTVELNFLEQVLTDNNLFNRIIQAENREEIIKLVKPEIDVVSLLTPVNLLGVTSANLWQIFSRIRFEYVRPTCTLRTQTMPKILPFMSLKDKLIGLKSYFLESLTPNPENIKLFKKLPFCKKGTVGYALHQYYQNNGNVATVDKPSMFPSSYILVHDFHHILLDVPTTVQGELEIIAFEEGMINRCNPPILLLEQLQIFLEAQGVDYFKTERIVKAWNIGVNSVDIFSDFPVSDYIEKDLNETRDKLNLVSLSLQ